MKVKEIILTNSNPPAGWKIDGEFYRNIKDIPKDLLDRCVFDWEADFWDARIKINTKYHI